jgi:3-oxoacyl-[acyl-carrier protein] reductase
LTYTSSNSDVEIANLREQINGLGGESVAVKADLRDPQSPERIVRHAVDAFGAEINVLVNNAGAEVVKPFEDITPDDFDSIFHLNVLAPLLLLQACKPHLKNGRIINVGSVGARAGFPELSLYCSSKAALEGMTRCWAAELGEQGHTVNSVNPGPVQSKMLDNIPKDIVDMQKKQTPVGRRLGTVDDVAQIVSWLASEESRWVTGQTISASGGWAMY